MFIQLNEALEMMQLCVCVQAGWTPVCPPLVTMAGDVQATDDTTFAVVPPASTDRGVMLVSICLHISGIEGVIDLSAFGTLVFLLIVTF